MRPDSPLARHRLMVVLVMLLAAVIGYVFASEPASAETVHGNVGAWPAASHSQP